MRYFHEIPDQYESKYGSIYICKHPLYDRCTLFTEGEIGLAIVQQRFSPRAKVTWWTEIDPWLTDELYQHEGFMDYFHKMAGPCENDIYPTVTIRQIMWALRMKPLKRERWETVFDRKKV